MGESLQPVAPPRAGHHPSLLFLCHLTPLCQALPHSRSIRRAFLPDDSVLYFTIHYGSGRYIVNGSLSAWHKSTVNSYCGSSDLCTRAWTYMHLAISPQQTHTSARWRAHVLFNHWSRLWKPVTVFKSAVMGILFKVLRNQVKVWQRSLFEWVQSLRGWGPAVLLLLTPLHRGAGRGESHTPAASKQPW